MDWKALSSTLGTVSDSLTGGDYFAKKQSQEANNATANRQIDVGVQQNTENNELKKLLQQLEIAAQIAAQDKGITANKDLQTMSQLFNMGESQKDRELRLQMQGTDIGARKELSVLDNAAALDRTMAPHKFEDDRFRKMGGYDAIPTNVLAQETFKGVPAGTTWGGMELLGKAGQAAGNFNDPFMMHGGYGAAKLQAEETRRMMDMAREAEARKANKGGFWSSLFGGSPGVPSTGTPAPRVSPFTPGK